MKRKNERIKWVGLLVLVPFLLSCGLAVQETVSPVTPPPPEGGYRKVAIVPFADYTPVFSPYGYLRRNVLVLESLQDELFKKGFKSVMVEDVVKYLFQRGVIRMVTQYSPAISLVQEELRGPWSDAVREDLYEALRHNLANVAKGGPESVRGMESQVALDSQIVKDLGEVFDVDYIIRGRIIEFGIDYPKDVFNPFEIGILPFIYNVGQRTFFGVAKADKYELLDKIALGGLATYFTTLKKGLVAESLFAGHWNYHPEIVANAAIWGGAWMATAYFAHKGGRVDRATVQIRMVLQDAHTGEIVWFNRAEVQTKAISVFAERDKRTLIQAAIQKAVQGLVDNMADYVSKWEKGGERVRAELREELLERMREAVRRAEEAAERAERASKKSERIFEKTLRK
ncbi:MAG: hypothetical protein DRG50_09480 [Deltaproteobacteria bacterium]|nr:MAG: hypothetical protein DRG50_09480 [Deltaproteobacteria bacterium]